MQKIIMPAEETKNFLEVFETLPKKGRVNVSCHANAFLLRSRQTVKPNIENISKANHSSG